MCDEWMPTIKLALTWEEYRQLPRNSAYKYEYLNGSAYITPRSRHYHARLTLEPMATAPEPGLPELLLRSVRSEDHVDLERLFAAAFRSIQPFGSLDDDARVEAARQALARTWTGGDGPWIEQASFVAERDSKTAGAILITLVPPGDPCNSEDYRWREPPPEDAVARRVGRPHLTWIFVSPLLSGHGVGTTLLAHAVNELIALGFSELVSTFMIGNDSSALWHWRSGFELLPYPSSYRHMHRRWARAQDEPRA